MNDSANTIGLSSIALLLLIAVAMLWPFGQTGNETATDDGPRTHALGVARPKQASPAEFPQSHRQTLRTEFPNYALPLKRDHLAEQLERAIDEGDASEVERLLQAGASANWTGVNSSWHSDTRAPLFRAIKRGNPKIVASLLAYGARAGGPTGWAIVASRNQWSQTPLYFAVRCGNQRIVELLLENGADIDASNGYGKTPLDAALEEENLALFRLLLSRGASCDFESRFREADRPDQKILFNYSPEYFVLPFQERAGESASSLLELARQSQDPELRDEVTQLYEASPIFALHSKAEQVVRKGDVESFRALIADGYEPARFDKVLADGRSLLELAKAQGHAPIVALLLETGIVDPAQDAELRLMQAIRSGSVEKLKELLKAGDRLQDVVLRLRNGHGKKGPASPLVLAVREQHEEMVSFLLERPEAQSGWLDDPELLLNAMPYYRHDKRPFSEEICKSLITAGAAISSSETHRTGRDYAPFILAARAGWVEVCKMLKARTKGDVPIDAALQAAAFGNRTEACRYLLSLGADPNHREKADTVSPFEYAMTRRNRQVFEMLVKAGAKKSYPPQHDGSKGYNRFEQYGHPLYHAALAGDTEFCRFLLEQFPPAQVWQPLLYEPYEYDNDIRYFEKGNTPLFAAVYGDHAETLKLLLSYGSQANKNGKPLVNVNAFNDLGSTALHEATHFNAGRCVQLLLAAGANPTRQDLKNERSSGNSPLHLTSRWPFADYSDPADQAGLFPILVAAAANGPDPQWANQINTAGMSPLHTHAKATNTANCLKLIDLGADVNAKTKDGYTPLFTAIHGEYNRGGASLQDRRQRSELCIKFVENGAQYEPWNGPQGSRYSSYYALAFAEGLFEFCDFLEKKNVSRQVKQFEGPYLCSAVMHRRPDLVRKLIAEGADVNAVDFEDKTALHWAVIRRDAQLCRALIEYGADPNIPDDDGRTAIFAVFERYHNHSQRFNTPRPRETQQEAITVLQVLLDSDADPLLADSNGKTVIQSYSRMPSAFREMIEKKQSESGCFEIIIDRNSDGSSASR